MTLIPSMILHATVAFGMLRQKGIEIGKTDFWGAIHALRWSSPQPHGVARTPEGIPQ